jgi:ribonuclease HI
MAELPLLTIHTDGASRGNPGAAAAAYVISRQGQPAIEVAECLGDLTNNQAEYTALVNALEHALELGAGQRVHVLSDSELMVKQMKGEYKVKNADLLDLYQDARELAQQFTGGVTYKHIRRAENARADALCNEALDGKRTSGRDKPQAETLAKPVAEAAPSVPKQESVNGDAEKLPRRTGQTLRTQAVACLWQAAAAWGTGLAEPNPELVWEQITQILADHGVRLPESVNAAVASPLHLGEKRLGEGLS